MTLQKQIIHNKPTASEIAKNQLSISVEKVQLNLEIEEVELLLKLLANNDQYEILEKISQSLDNQNIQIDSKKAPMRYSDFTLQQVLEDFKLNSEPAPLFLDVPLIPSEELALFHTILERNTQMALNTEKVRSESIVFPVLVELLNRNPKAFTFFSGTTFEVDKSKGLTGRCDFLLSNTEKGGVYSIYAPVFAIVEAKKTTVDENLGQCASELVAARMFNQRHKRDYETIYGAVTTGTEWIFMKLEGDTIYTDTKRYYGNELDRVISILQYIVDFYKTQTTPPDK